MKCCRCSGWVCSVCRHWWTVTHTHHLAEVCHFSRGSAQSPRGEALSEEDAWKQTRSRIKPQTADRGAERGQDAGMRVAGEFWGRIPPLRLSHLSFNITLSLHLWFHIKDMFTINIKQVHHQNGILLGLSGCHNVPFPHMFRTVRAINVFGLVRRFYCSLFCYVFLRGTNRIGGDVRLIHAVSGDLRRRCSSHGLLRSSRLPCWSCSSAQVNPVYAW